MALRTRYCGPGDHVIAFDSEDVDVDSLGEERDGEWCCNEHLHLCDNEEE